RLEDQRPILSERDHQPLPQSPGVLVPLRLQVPKPAGPFADLHLPRLARIFGEPRLRVAVLEGRVAGQGHLEPARGPTRPFVPDQLAVLLRLLAALARRGREGPLIAEQFREDPWPTPQRLGFALLLPRAGIPKGEGPANDQSQGERLPVHGELRKKA